MPNPLPFDNVDSGVLRAKYKCTYCDKEVNGLIQYYQHIAFYHEPDKRPLKKGKRVTRAPLASELLDAMARAGAGLKRAARVLDVSVPFLKKWGEILIPVEWAEYKKRPVSNIGTGCGNRPLTSLPSYKLGIEVLAGNKPAPRGWQLYPHERMAKLQRYGLLTDSCHVCGFHEKRVSDYKSPMLLDFIDGDRTNWKIGNLRILCYNCYFLNVHDMWGKSKVTALTTG